MALTKLDEERETEKRKKEAAQIQEEIAYLRQKCNSLSMRGDYAACFKLIEDNLNLLYFKERWPENFISILRLHQRCYPSLNRSQSYDTYAATLLKKHKIPAVLVQILKKGEKNTIWSAEYFRECALNCRKGEDYETALDYCQLVVKLDPLSSNARLLEGWVLEDMGKHEQARELYEQALELNEANYQASISLAMQYSKKEPQKALEYIDKAIKASPNEASFYGTKADILVLTGNKKAALHCYDEAAAREPYEPEYPYKKARLLEEQGEESKALSMYRRALAANENHAPSLVRLAEKLEEKQPDGALDYINRVTRLEPNNKKAQLMKARLRYRTGDSIGAARQYRRVLAEDENNLEALSGLGQALLEDHPEEALGYFERAVEKDRSSVMLRMGKARAHQRLNQDEEAIQEYKAASGLDKKDPQPLAALGGLYAETKPEMALDYYRKACTLAPNNPYYQADQGMLLMKMPGHEEEAIECLNKACSLDPGNAILHMQLGDMLCLVDNRASAAKHYREAVNLNPDLDNAHFGLAKVLISTDPHISLIHINHALELDGVNSNYYALKSLVMARLAEEERQVDLLQEYIEKHSVNEQTITDLTGLFKGDGLLLALMYIDRAVEMETNNPGFVCIRAQLFDTMGQTGKAVSQYEELLKLDAQNHEALFGLGKILASRKDKKALEYFEKALKLHPQEPAYHAGKARYLAAAGDYEKALASYDTAISLDKYGWEYRLGKAQLMDDHDDWENAQEEYRHVLMMHRDCLHAAVRMGIMLADEKPQAALGYLDHAIRLDPDKGSHHIWRARLLYQIGRDSEADDECRIAVELDGGLHETHCTMAKALQKVLPETALKYAEMAWKEEETNADYRLLYGNILLDMGRRSEAAVAFAEALERNPGLHEATEKSAQILMAGGRSEECLELLNAALEKKRDCPVCLSLKARALLERQESSLLPEAIQAVQTALQKEPDCVSYRELLVELLEKKRAPIKSRLEKAKLERLRQKLAQEKILRSNRKEIDFSQNSAKKEESWNRVSAL